MNQKRPQLIGQEDSAYGERLFDGHEDKFVLEDS